jgi:hypothetical protein
MCRNLELLQAFDERGDTGPEMVNPHGRIN